MMIHNDAFYALLSESEPLTAEGRRDLRKIRVQGAKKVTGPQRGINVASGYVELRNRECRGIDFTGSDLPEWRLHTCRFIDCVFDNAKCRGWRVWGTTFLDCSFRNTDLRNSSLNGAVDGNRDRYMRVNFSGANLSGLTFVDAAEFIECTFVKPRLRKIDFGPSVFKDCTFVGELFDVLFFGEIGNVGGGAVNEMRNVDMSATTLRYVGFRKLDLETLKPPTSPEHIVIKEYGSRLVGAIGRLGGREDQTAQIIGRFLQEERRWLGAHQVMGIINRRDLEETFSPAVVRELLMLLGGNS
jgi:uncharacterized protein YjbI with pentapeptide repeats